MNHPKRLGGIAWACAIVLAALAAEWMLFEASVREYVLGTYPRHHDQTEYLNLAYLNYTRMSLEGPLSAFAQRISESKPQGALLDFEAALAFRFIEPNRVGALSVGFLHFATLQIATLYVVASVTRSIGFGLIAFALLAASNFPFLVPGGIFDFRIDLSASCAFGIYIAAVVRSGFFRNLPWAIGAGATAGYLIALRHNMVVHVAALNAAFFVAILLRQRWKKTETNTGEVERWRGFAASVMALAIIGGPVLINDLAATAEYYLSQFGVRAPVRNALSGRNAFEHFLFYPYAIWFHQVRYPALIALGLGTFLLTREQRAQQARSALQRPRVLDHYLPAFLGAALPVLILTAHSDRSPAAIGLTFQPATLLLTFGLVELAYRKNVLRPPLISVAFAALLLGLGLQARQHFQWRHDQSSQEVDERAAFEMHYDLGRLMYRLGIANPIYLPNTLAEFLEPGATATPMFERDGILMIPRIPTRTQQIFPIEADRFWKLLPSTDAVLVQTRGEAIDFPFTKFMKDHRHVVDEYVQQNMVHVGDWSLRQAAVSAWVAPKLYLRDGVNLDRRLPDSAGATSFGLRLPTAVLRSRPRVVLQGARATAANQLVARAALDGRPLETTTAAGSGDELSITIDFPPHLLPDDQLVSVDCWISPGPEMENGEPSGVLRLPQRGVFVLP